MDFLKPKPKSAALSARNGRTGYVFVCSNSTQQECQTRRLFGSPDRELSRMQQTISLETHLFLFNMETYTLLGPFVPSGKSGYGIVQGAFHGKFNAQIRIKPFAGGLREVVLGSRPSAGPKSGTELSMLSTQLEKGRALVPKLQQAWGAEGAISQEGSEKSLPKKPIRPGRPMVPREWSVSGSTAIPANIRVMPAVRAVSGRQQAAPRDTPAGKRSYKHSMTEEIPQSYPKRTKLDDSSDRAGYLFVCNNATQQECEQLKLFGAPHQELSQMKQCIVLGTPLLLFNMQSLKIFGPFSAASSPALALVPGAFGGKFSAHVRVSLGDSPLCEAQLKQRMAGGPKSAAEWQQFTEFLFEAGPAEERLHEIWLDGVQVAEPDVVGDACDASGLIEEHDDSNQAVEDPYGDEAATGEDQGKESVEEANDLLQQADELQERGSKVLLEARAALDASESAPAMVNEDSGGYLFMCSTSTQRECENLSILAAPESELSQMRRSITVGTPVFLLNFQTLELIGVFCAVGLPDRNVAPGAFGGRYSAQVEVAVPGMALRHVKVERRLPSGVKSAADVKALQEQLHHGSLVDPDAQECWRRVEARCDDSEQHSVDRESREYILQRPLTKGVLQMLSPEARQELEGDLQTLVQDSGATAEIQSSSDEDAGCIVLRGNHDVVSSKQSGLEEILDFYGIELVEDDVI